MTAVSTLKAAIETAITAVSDLSASQVHLAEIDPEGYTWADWSTYVTGGDETAVEVWYIDGPSPASLKPDPTGCYEGTIAIRGYRTFANASSTDAALNALLWNASKLAWQLSIDATLGGSAVTKTGARLTSREYQNWNNLQVHRVQIDLDVRWEMEAT